MKPLAFPEVNCTLAKPASMTDEECESLPCHFDQTGDIAPRFISRWTFTPEERAAIAAGADLWLHLYSRSHPPLALTTEDPFKREKA